MLRLTAAFLLLSPAIASAQCLTAAALDTGITVEYASGDISYLQRSENGGLVDAFYERDSYFDEIVIFESQNGIFPEGWSIFEAGRWDKQRGANISYASTPSTPLSVGATGIDTITVSNTRRFDGDKTFSWAVYASEPLVIGECSYEAVRVFTYISDISNGVFYANEIKYLPELGFGLQLANSYFGFSPENATIVSMAPS